MIENVASLYKRGKGNFLVWTIAVVTEGTKVSLKMTYGVVNMAETIEWQHNIKRANIGKANEQSPYERAFSLANSRAKTKMRSGYKDLEDLKLAKSYEFVNTPSLVAFLEIALPKFNTDIEDNEIPMKCQQYFKSSKTYIDPVTKEKKEGFLAPDGSHWKDRKYYYIKNPYGNIPLEHITIKFPNVTQPKVNGVRAFSKVVNNKVKLYSKKGLEYKLPHIIEFLEANLSLFKVNGEDVILDGELYIPGEQLGVISSAVTAMQLNTMRLEYHLFDIAVDDMNQVDRLKHLYSPENKLTIGLDSPVKLVKAVRVKDNATVQRLTDEFIAEGYEGSIQREYDLMYKFGSRPMSITKLKRTISAEFRIIDVIPQEKDDTLGLFVCTTGREEFKVTPHGDHAFKQKVRLQSHKFIGKDLTIVFYEYTEKGIPFHLIENVVRDYE